jgi:hypothetical protein
MASILMFFFFFLLKKKVNVMIYVAIHEAIKVKTFQASPSM